jgi:hypothetical protein
MKTPMKKLLCLCALSAMCGGCATVHRMGFFVEDTRPYVEVYHYVSPLGFEYDWYSSNVLTNGETLSPGYIINPAP